MNTSLVLTLDKRRAKKDGSYPVIIRISHYERSTSFATGISVMEKDWDFDKKMIRKTYTGVDGRSNLEPLIADYQSFTLIYNPLQVSNHLFLCDWLTNFRHKYFIGFFDFF